jgi:SAM-dependent methyltransferase
MSCPTDALGRSSYEVLADAIPAGDGAVLDLACGDGFLVETVHRCAPHRRVVGVDLNAAELSAACRRLGSAQELLRGSADQLPIASSSISVVTAHYALMLLLPIDAVLAEVRRVLQPTGSLVAVVPGPTRADTPNGWMALRSAFAAVRDAYPIEFPTIQDERVLATTGRADLLRHAGLDVITDREIELRDRIEPTVAFEQLWSTYGPDLLPDDARTKLRDELQRRLSALTEPDGRVPMIYTFDLVVATARH